MLDRATGNRKRKCYATYTDGDGAEISKFAAENGNMVALKCFRKDFQELKSKNKTANTFISVILMNITNIQKKPHLRYTCNTKIMKSTKVQTLGAI